jgi:uncharacterized protein YnzC (UPF0291/DUF896 family)
MALFTEKQIILLKHIHLSEKELMEKFGFTQAYVSTTRKKIKDRINEIVEAYNALNKNGFVDKEGRSIYSYNTLDNW